MARTSSGGVVSRAVHRLRAMSYLHKWLILGAVIGVVAGVGALAFSAALDVGTNVLLGWIGGYVPPSPIGEGNVAGSVTFTRPWAIPLVVGLGGLLSGTLVFTLAPEAEGHGTDSAIAAVHHNPRGIRARVSIIKIIASAITIGAGGSGGREGPTAQISAGFGSMMSRALDLSPEDARIAVTVGTGAGIGAIFRAPLGGALLGSEILYRDDVEVQALIPSLVASVVGFSIFGAVHGFTPIFGFLHGYRFTHPIELVYFALIGLAAGSLGRLYAASFYGVAANRRRIPGPDLIKPALGGLLVGALGLAVPGVLGTGYGWVQDAMSSSSLRAMSLWVVLVLPLAKIAATSLSIGSGGSGGIFGPGMVIGAFLGAGAWRLLEPIAPGVPHEPAAFVIVGMTACFGSVAHAPLALLLMVAEMTGSLELLAPAMVAIGLASVTVGGTTIYESQLASRSESPAHRFRFGLPLVAGLPVTRALKPPRVLLSVEMYAGSALGRLRAEGVPGAPVTDASGKFVGTVDVERLTSAEDQERVSSLLYKEAPVVSQDAALDDVVEALAMSTGNWVPVLDARGAVLGIVSVSDVLLTYREELESGVRRFGEAFGGMMMVDGRVAAEATPDGRAVRDVPWPAGTMVLTIQRGDHLLVPTASTVLGRGDVISAIAPAGTEGRLRALLGEPPSDEEGPGTDMV